MANIVARILEPRSKAREMTEHMIFWWNIFLCIANCKHCTLLNRNSSFYSCLVWIFLSSMCLVFICTFILDLRFKFQVLFYAMITICYIVYLFINVILFLVGWIFLRFNWNLLHLMALFHITYIFYEVTFVWNCDNATNTKL